MWGRKIVMTICAVLILPVVFVSSFTLWISVGLFGPVTASHQGWSANLFSTASDMFLKRAFGSMVVLELKVNSNENIFYLRKKREVK
jgi:ACS family hexuronate transporter-like MFS transporter